MAALKLLLLCLSSFLAGFVDSVAGGGGLIQLPALFILLPAEATVSVASLFGTNKFSAIAGTSLAAFQYARQIRIPWRPLWPACVSAFSFSFVGAWTVSLLDPQKLRPVILMLLIAVAVFTCMRKSLGTFHFLRFEGTSQVLVASCLGAAIGFYDGFFGPGTGTFLLFLFVGIMGFDFLTASASAKIVNFSTNLAALCFFVSQGSVLYAYAVPMALCNMLGAALGTQLAILKGNVFIRRIFLAVITLMILRFAYDLWRGRW